MNIHIFNFLYSYFSTVVDLMNGMSIIPKVLGTICNYWKMKPSETESHYLQQNASLLKH